MEGRLWIGDCRSGGTIVAASVTFAEVVCLNGGGGTA